MIDVTSKRRICILLFLLAIVLLLTGCGNNVDLTKGTIDNMEYTETEEVTNYVKIVANKDKVILLELYPDIAPITVKNFQDLISEKFKSNGIENNLKHEKGIVSMARSDDMNSASSQFFICVSDDVSYLDGNYAAFGKVIAGYNAVEEISKFKTDIYDKPISKQSIKTMRFVNINGLN